MKARFVSIIAGMFALLSLAAQGIGDSVVHIPAVSVVSERFFIKEEAGTRETEIDSSVFRSKVNTSLSDLLSENTPIFIKNHGRGALATASFRGTAPSHTRVSWNGIPVNSPMTGMVDFSLIPVYVIDELKLKHGAASIADGSGGIGGSVELGNSLDWNHPWSLRYLQGVGSYGTWNEFLQFGLGKNKIRSRTRLYHHSSSNDFTFINRGIAEIDPETGNLIHPVDTNDMADYRIFGIMQELVMRPGPNQKASLRYWGQLARRTIPRPTSYEGPENSNLNDSRDEDHKLSARYQVYGKGFRLNLISGYSDKQLLYKQMNRVPGLGTIPAIYSKSREQGFLNQAKVHLAPDSSFSMEISARYDHFRVTSNDSVSLTGYEKVQNRGALFLALRKNLAGALNLNLMLRQEWVGENRVPLIPFLGMDYRPFREADLLIKASNARNYRHPTLNELYWQPGGNLDLLPEQGFSMEGGVAWRLQRERVHIRSEISAYRSVIEQWIIWIPSFSGLWEPMNMKKVRSSGLELNTVISGEMGKWNYKVSAAYALTWSINAGDPLVWGDASTGKQLPYIPVHSGNLMADLGYGRWSLTYQYNAYSERFTTSSNDRSSWRPFYPYFMNDISLGRDFTIRTLSLQLEFKVQNLLNERYYSVLLRPMPGRNFLFTLILDLAG